MAENIHTAVIGAGQAGLSVSYYLKQQGIEHIVLDKSGIGASWRQRWDSFTLVTPNAMNNLPDFPSGGDPDGFLERDAVIRYLEDFATSFAPPLRTGVLVTAVTPQDTGQGFTVETDAGPYHCHNVVVATSIFQQPRLPAGAAALPAGILQLHSSQYRHPSALPDGAVLVVGSGQSGTQIVDELLAAGRQVYLSVSRAGRAPRRYRGRDIMAWMRLFQLFEMPVHQLESPAERFEAHLHLSGRDGGKTLNLRRFGREGVVLLGKVAGVAGDCLYLADDLTQNLQAADTAAARLCGMIDKRIEESGIEAPLPTAEELLPESWEPRETGRELSLAAAGISAVVWATGYRFNFNWIKGLDVDVYGYPVQQQGVTAQPGLYFAGLHWLNKFKSGLLYGVAEDAAHVAAHLAGQRK